MPLYTEHTVRQASLDTLCCDSTSSLLPPFLLPPPLKNKQTNKNPGLLHGAFYQPLLFRRSGPACRCQFILTLAVTLSLAFIDSELCSSALLHSNPAVIRKGQRVGSLLLCCQCPCLLLRYLLALAFGWRPNEQPVRRRSGWWREEMSAKAYLTPRGIQYSCPLYS